MGDYKNLYEKYYKGMKENSYKKNNYSLNKRKTKNKYKNTITKQCIGAAFLLVGFCILKNIPLEGANDIYIISKEAVSRDLNVSETVMAINVPGLESYKEKTLDYIDRFKRLVTGRKTTKELIKEDFILPIKGKCVSLDGKKVGVAIEVDGIQDVFCSYDGTVEDIEISENQSHITINHGNGVETYYGLLSNVNVKEGDKVQKGQSIGKTGIINSVKSNGIVYKIIYMGIEKNPSDLLIITDLENV